MVEYKVVLLKRGIRTTIAKVKTLAEADKIKDKFLNCYLFSGKSIIIEKMETLTTIVSTTPFTGIDLTY